MDERNITPFNKSQTSEGRRRLRPADWPMMVKGLVGVITVIGLALGITTYVNARTFQTELREKIGAEFETLASAQMNHLADILSEQLTILQSIALSDAVKQEAEAANERYNGDAAAIEAQLLAVDEQWQAASDDSQLVQSIVNPQSNEIAFQLLDYAESFPDHVEILLTDRYGGLLAATGRTSDYYQAEEAWWQAIYNGGEGAFYIGQPEYDGSTGYTALNMAVPIVSEETDEVIGVVRTAYRVDAIHRVVSNLQFGETGHVTVADSDGLVVADPNPEHIGERVPSSWYTADVLNMPSHWHEIVDEEGVPALMGQATTARIEGKREDKSRAIQSLGWVLFVTQSQAEAYVPVTSAVRAGLLAAGAFAVVAAGLAFMIARVVVTPITDLARVARQMAAGDLSARARLRRHDETGELAEAFNNLADKLTGMVVTLEQRVAERTQDLERRTRYLETTAEVARDAAAMLDLGELLTQVVTLVSERFGFYHAGVFLLDEAGQYAILRAANSQGGQRMLARGHRLKVGEVGIVGYATGTGEPRIALDVGADAVHFENPDLPETRSEMALPLRARGEIIGALDVQSTEPEAFSEEDVAVLQTLADQVATAISNARLVRQTQEALEAERRAYGELSRQAWQELLRTRPSLGYRYDESGVVSINGKSNSLGGDTPTGAPFPGKREANDSELDSVIVEDLPELSLPVKVRGHVIGTIHARKPGDAREWTAEETSLMEELVEQLSAALEGARLYHDTQRRAARERLSREITDTIRSAASVEDAIQRAVREMGRVLGASEMVARIGTKQALLSGREGNENE